MESKEPIITTQGLDEIQVRIKLAYPGKSWQALLLTNESYHHHLAGLVIRYEILRQDGTRLAAKELIYDSEVSFEVNPFKLRNLLYAKPIIPPRSSWLVGLGVDRIRLTTGLPSFEESQALFSLRSAPTKADFPRTIEITIDSAILEDGRIVGPQIQNIRQLAHEIDKEERGRSIALSLPGK